MTCRTQSCERAVVRIKHRLCMRCYQRERRQGTIEIKSRSGSACSVDECSKPPWTRGLCHAHYQRWRRHGTTDKLRGVWRKCELCPRRVRAKGLCQRHYEQRQRILKSTKRFPRLPRVPVEPLRQHLLTLVDRGATVSALQERCHVDYRTMQGWLNGKCKTTFRATAEDVCDYLGLHPAMLWGDWVICRHGHTSCEKCGFDDFFEGAVAS